MNLKLFPQKLKNNGCLVLYIVDSGFTEFNGESTVTCCAIDSALSEDIDRINGNLKLL